MNAIESFSNKYTLPILFSVYFLVRLIFLNSVPVFNDESIYLNWGWRELHQPGALFYSLIDGKQPLLMWVFGIFESIFNNQVFAGRIVAIIAGSLTLFGIYKISNRYYTKKIAVLASLFYIGIPIFSFYDRLALMESSVAACGIWSLYFLLRFIETNEKKQACVLGLILGVGFFIKSSMALFIISTFIILGLSYYLRKKQKNEILFGTFWISLCFLAVTFVLFLQPMYWQTLSMNSRYSLTISELLGFPVLHFIQNFFGNLQILSIFFTLPVFIFGLVGGYYLIKKNSTGKTIVIWFLILLFFQMLLTRGTTQRYLVSYLPILCIFAAYAVEKLFRKKAAYIGVTLLCLIFVFSLTFFQMISPFNYNKTFEKVTSYTDGGVFYGQNSGYGIDEVVQKIISLSNSENTFVAVALNTGNPEDAIMTYFHRSTNIKSGYFDKRLFPQEIDTFDCITSDTKFYFVSRDEQQADMNKYLENIYRVKHPYSDYSIGIYQFKEGCTGKTLQISPFAPQI